MSDESRAIWQRIDEHSAVIHQMQLDRASDKADTDARLNHLEQGQARQIEIMTRIEAKVDGNTVSLSRSEGGLKVGMWLAGLLLSIAGLWLAFVKFFQGGG